MKRTVIRNKWEPCITIFYSNIFYPTTPLKSCQGRKAKNEKDTGLAQESYLLHIHRVTELVSSDLEVYSFHLATSEYFDLFCRLLLNTEDVQMATPFPDICKCPFQTMPTGNIYLFQKSPVSSLSYLNSLNFFSCPKLMHLCWRNETTEIRFKPMGQVIHWALASRGKDINGFCYLCVCVCVFSQSDASKQHNDINTVCSNSVPTIKPCNDAVSSHDACPQGDNV